MIAEAAKAMKASEKQQKCAAELEYNSKNRKDIDYSIKDKYMANQELKGLNWNVIVFVNVNDLIIFIVCDAKASLRRHSKTPWVL